MSPPESAAQQAAGRLLVLLGRSQVVEPQVSPGAFETTLDLDTLARLARSGAIARHLLRYRETVAVAERFDALPRPFLLLTILRMLTRGPVLLRDGQGGERCLAWTELLSLAARYVADTTAARRVQTRVLTALDELESLGSAVQRQCAPFPHPQRVLLLRTDLWLGVKAGGSVAHTAGIANAFSRAGIDTTHVAFESNPILAATVHERILPPPPRYWDVPDLPALAGNLDLETSLRDLMDDVRPDVVYHRLAAFSFMGALLARRCRIPLVVEYNGSEAWIARHWGRPLRRETLALRIERAVLAAADRIVCVSQPLADELAGRGIPRRRIVTVPNGVDTEAIHPGLDGAAARRRLGLGEGETIIGFIGTFGIWHGVGVLVEAFARLVAARGHCDNLRLLLIGDGPERAAADESVDRHGIRGRVCMTGAVPQSAAPQLMAAADILVAPHLPNADGSEFFGSPTKLFEYMALGRCIVASRLGQIAEILTDEHTALLVTPGDAGALAAGLARAVKDLTLRCRLGDNARNEAVLRHDWRHRLEAILA